MPLIFKKSQISLILYCAVPENIHTHPMEGQWKFQGGGRSQKPNFKRKVWDLSGNSRGMGGGGGGGGV